jgi:hypothetical protein
MQESATLNEGVEVEPLRCPFNRLSPIDVGWRLFLRRTLVVLEIVKAITAKYRREG